MNVREKEIEKKTERYDARAIVRYLIPRILFGICGFFAAQATLPFGARPFGVALLSAVAGKTVIPIYLGVSVAAFVGMEPTEAVLYFGVYTALMLVRILVNLAGRTKNISYERTADLKNIFKGTFDEKIGARALVAATFGLLLGAVMLFFGGMLYYDLFAMILLTALSPIATLIICGYFRLKDKDRGEAAMLWRDVGFLAFAGIATFGARTTVIFGVSVAVFGIILSTFLVSYMRGVGYGAILGLVLGICYSPMLSPMFVLAAISAGIFIRFSPALAAFCAFITASAWAFYVEGLSALLGVFGGILSACLLYSVLHKIIFIDFSKSAERSEKKENAEVKKARTECTILSDSALDGIKLYEMNVKMNAISNALQRVSSFSGEINGRDYGLEKNDFSCVENYNFQFTNNEGMIDCGALSALLTKTMEENIDDYKTDIELSKRMCFALTELDFLIVGVAVFGVRKKTIYIKGKSRKLLEENLQSIAESIVPFLPFSLDMQSAEIRREGDGEAGALLLFEKQKISTSVVRRRVIAKGESVCGDSVAVFKNHGGRFFAVLSDGMGSGEEASAVSQVCTSFLFNMLSAGGMNTELISMLNSFICGCRVGARLECSATLDLLEVDLFSGRAEIYKCGAAPSYVFRKGKLFKIRSKTMPIGILGEVDVKCFSFNFCKGDIVVMVSDGVCGEGGECPWLFDLLVQNLPCRTLERTAELIVKYSSAKGSVDDISVVLIEIK